MTAAPDTLTVLMDGAVAAHLRNERNNELTLTYDHGYMNSPETIPLSTSLPFAHKPHHDLPVERWIRSLLPDNPVTLSKWLAAEQQSTPFGLLSTRVGLDCAGAVQFCPHGEEDRLDAQASGLTRLGTAETTRELETIINEPGSWHPDDVEPYFSLAGFQSKIALHSIDSQWARPYGRIPTTHILKPRGPEARFVPITEHVCLAAARHLGLDTATSRIETYGQATTLVVERYDRAEDDGQWRRIHQEDMCQALGVDGARKYEHNGGPGMTQIGDLLRQCSTQPDSDLRKFADALIYSWLIINRDGHARNYSLLHRSDGPRLAPLYDINSSLMFKKRKIGEANMSMRYGSTFTVYSAGSRHALADMAARLVLPPEEVIARADELASRLPDAVQRAVAGLPEQARSASQVEQFTEAVGRRAAECRKSISAAAKLVRDKASI